MLDNIKSAYAFYSRPVAFDAQGVVRAASRSEEGDGLIGSHAPAAWLQAVAKMGDPQRHAASRFEDTALHSHGRTYVYLAAVQDEHDAQRLAGGIAIVFNAAAELVARQGQRQRRDGPVPGRPDQGARRRRRPTGAGACARQLFGVRHAARRTDGMLLVIRSPHQPTRPAYALRVDNVLSVLDIPRQRLHGVPQGFGQFASWVTGNADCQAVNAGRCDPVLVQVLDAAGLAQAGLGRYGEAAAQEASLVAA